jgi:plastocyanin
MRPRMLTIAALALTLTACGSSYSTQPNGTTTTVSIVAGASLLTNTAFGVNPLTISTGTTVKWTNSDNMSHTSTSNTGVWDSGQISAGTSYSYTFRSAGTYPYHCSNHPGMAGVIIVQ